MVKSVGKGKRLSVLLAASAASLGLVSCIQGPNFVRPQPPTVMSYTAQPLPPETVSADTIGGDAQRFLQDNDVPGDWWTLFGSPALNGLVEQALRANPDLEVAQAALRQAGENYLATAGTLLPQVNGSAAVSRSESVTTRRTSDLFTATVSVSYIVDVFGALRRSLEAQGALEENSRFQLEATYLTLISNVIITAIQQASLNAQIAAIQDIITAQSQQLDLLNQQFELGAVARGDVLAQQSQLAQTQASLPPLQRQVEQSRNTLSILLGRYPAENQIPNIELTDLMLPRDLPLSVPSKLVEQRPDVRASEALLHQASAQVGVATANLFPQITLSASGTDSTLTLPEFVTLQTTGYNLAAGLTQPIFRGGTLRAQRRAAVDAFDRASAQYRSIVLNAFSNVANVLAALEHDAETLQVQLYAEQTAEQSLEITTERFQAGAIAYLSLLDAQRVYQQARILLVVAQANRFSDTVALFQALGGGWWNRQDVADGTTPPAP